MGYNGVQRRKNRGDVQLKTFLIILVAISFLSAIFTAGYEEKGENFREQEPEY
ncbi:hypothetical protein B4099_2297 [Heyndrickxia coagulans]|uniref:Uncharacterized protein n=1 Tax=Heyndrickxia coagulans TaxID=1398 RepID=A0A150K9Z3_HEYCO|nr:hypothetical protein B4099_2297 [Heyndrickxia coagulans]